VVLDEEPGVGVVRPVLRPAERIEPVSDAGASLCVGGLRQGLEESMADLLELVLGSIGGGRGLADSLCENPRFAHGEVGFHRPP
jgi:hypothetical protein